MIKYLFLSIFITTSSFALDKAIKERLKSFRDPFKRNISVLKSKKEKASQKTYFTNKADPAQINVQSIKVTGVFLGERRRAIAIEMGDARAEPFVLSEGMLLGPEKIRVGAILPGGIVLVEKVKNIYDEDEYLETIIPVSD